MGHLGEPKNCWLPLEQMTDSGNYRYYKANPQYHMYLHPEAPSYDDQINARDNLLRKHPGLVFVAAHLASLEWNVDEIATRLDMFPNMNIDLSARMAHLQYQSVTDLQHVRNFLIKYQDRVAYGTDITISPDERDPEARLQALLERWKSNWIYLATDSVQKIKNISGDVKGLRLPKEVIDKIYKRNADRFFSHTGLTISRSGGAPIGLRMASKTAAAGSGRAGNSLITNSSITSAGSRENFTSFLPYLKLYSFIFLRPFIHEISKLVQFARSVHRFRNGCLVRLSNQAVRPSITSFPEYSQYILHPFLSYAKTMPTTFFRHFARIARIFSIACVVLKQKKCYCCLITFHNVSQEVVR